MLPLSKHPLTALTPKFLHRLQVRRTTQQIILSFTVLNCNVYWVINASVMSTGSSMHQ